MASIGHVCVQWALLEHSLLSLIGTVEAMPLEKVYRIFGSLDMMPRCNMTINLARDAKAPTALVKRILAVRKELQDGLDQKRNQVIHGVHAFTGVNDSVQLTMPRWSEPKRTQTVTALEMAELGQALNRLSSEVLAIGEDFFNWQQRVAQNRLDHIEREIAIARTPIVIKIAKDAHRRFQHWIGDRRG